MSLRMPLAVLGGLLAWACAGTYVIDVGPTSSVADFGADGQDQAPDTAAIQAAIDAMPPGGTLRFPPGTYRIETDRGVRLKDGVRLDLGEATLVGPNVNGARCRIFTLDGVRDVTISGGTLVGSRSGSPQWGVGIFASDATDVVIENVAFRDFFFDGILLTGNAGCRRIAVRGVLSENNRRTGLAIPSGFDVTVEDSTFRGSHGQSPEAGVNCEPGPGAQVRGVTFRRNQFTGNAGVGLYVHRALGVSTGEAHVEESLVEGNGQGIIFSGVDQGTIRGNRVRGHRARGRSGIAVGTDAARIVVVGNELSDNFRGITVAGASGIEVRDNVVTGTGVVAGAPGAGNDGDGIVCRGLSTVIDRACVVAGNTVRRASGSGIVAHLVSRVAIVDNVVADAGQRGIHLRGTAGSEVRRNSVSGSGLEAPQRYDAIEVADSSHGNIVASNVCRLNANARQAIGIGAGCNGNTVVDNIIHPN